MAVLFCIEDEIHAELVGEGFVSFQAALTEVRRLASIPWDVEPNVAPCKSWRTCGRHYEIVEYETSTEPSWKELRRFPVVEVMSDGVRWNASQLPLHL